MEYETPTLETQIAGQPFTITGDFQALQAIETKQRREQAIDMAKAVLSAPFTAIRSYAGRVLAEIEVDIYDRRYHTNFRQVITDERLRRKHEAKARRIGEKLFGNPDMIVPKRK